MEKFRTKKNYIYNGFGFSLIIENAIFYYRMGDWLLELDVLGVADRVIRLLVVKPSGLTGGEVFFARTYFNFSKRKLAEKLNVSHTAVNKWEDRGNDKAHMDILTEVAFRSFVKLQLNEDKDFPRFYREMMNDAKKFADPDNNELLKIAV